MKNIQIANMKIENVSLKANKISLSSPDVQLGNYNQGYVMVSGGSSSGKNAVKSTCVQA